MKKIVLSIVLLTFISCINSGFANDTLRPKPKTDWEKEGLKGKVKMICHTDSNIKSTETVSDTVLMYYSVYGYTTEIKGSQPIKSKIVSFYYDTNNYLLKRCYFNNGKSLCYLYYYYGFDGKPLINETTYFPDSSYIKEYFYFDNSGNIKSKTTSYKSRNNQTLYEYDSNCNIKEEIFKVYDKITGGKKYYYNELNQIISSKSYNKDSEIIQSNEYKYLSGNLCEEKWFDEDNNLFNSFLYEYFFDNKGNWICKYKYRNNKLESVLKREITYYDE